MLAGEDHNIRRQVRSAAHVVVFGANDQRYGALGNMHAPTVLSDPCFTSEDGNQR